MKKLLFHVLTKCGVVLLLLAATVAVIRPDMTIPGKNPGMECSVCGEDDGIDEDDPTPTTPLTGIDIGVKFLI